MIPDERHCGALWGRAVASGWGSTPSVARSAHQARNGPGWGPAPSVARSADQAGNRGGEIFGGKPRGRGRRFTRA